MYSQKLVEGSFTSFSTHQSKGYNSIAFCSFVIYRTMPLRDSKDVIDCS
jgi:hypothetical protein